MQAKIQEAAAQLVAKLVDELGYPISKIQVYPDFHRGEPNGLKVKIDLWLRARVTVHVSEFWRHPGVACYFVNYSHDNGDFLCHSGTPSLCRAMFDIGGVAQLANAAKERLAA